MQPETLNRSIQPTPTVHPRGFTPRPVQLSMAVDSGEDQGSCCGVHVAVLPGETPVSHPLRHSSGERGPDPARRILRPPRLEERELGSLRREGSSPKSLGTRG